MLTKQQLKEFALNSGMAVFGIADISKIKEHILIPDKVKKDLNIAISAGYRLSGSVLDTLEDGPNQIYYFHYQRVNMFLDNTALKITALIQKEGYKALPVPASQVIDWENNKGAVSHREIAELAGIGWRGRNSLTVTPDYGAQVRFLTVLADIPLEVDKPLNDNCGGTCRACIKVCPADAISEKPEDYNVKKCRDQLKEFQKTKNISHMICGLCVKVCAGNNSKSKIQNPK